MARVGSEIGTTKGGEELSSYQAAELAGVYHTYISRVAAKTAVLREAQGVAEANGELIPEAPVTYLDGRKSKSGNWVFDRSEVERFSEARRQPQVVLGYDITWSAPKSVSALYAQGDHRIRGEVDAAIESAVAVGMGYLETEGFHVRAGRSRERAEGMVAASYRHMTNRALEPQLHEHVVVANMATSSVGEVRAVDARGLYGHATAAGYLAAAQLRHELSARLGVEWGEVHKGLADIDGVDRGEIMAVSSRRKDVLSLSEELGFTSPQARQTAALATRPGKDHSVEAVELQRRWKELLGEAGLTEAKVEGLVDRASVALWRPADTDELFGHLGSHRGVTEQQAIFDRRDVIMAISEQSVDRLTAGEVVDLADRWLMTEAVVPLEVTDGARRETIGRGSAQVSLAPDEARYTTPRMLAIEQRVVDLHDRGFRIGKAQVEPVVVERAITDVGGVNGIELGADQAAMVRAITTSGDQFQAVVGLAGAGKTTATRAAIAAWESAGFDVIGAAPFAEAARNLETETGLRSQTLEGLLTRVELAGDPRDVLSPNTVIVVDEASTIGNRQLDRLYRAAAETGASLRTIGDPKQHQSVEAGGLWQHLTDRFPERTPVLDENRRQTGPGMGEVRIALDEYRDGLIDSAMRRLEADDRFVTAETWDGLLDAMSADWYLDHQRHVKEGARPSKMIAERNSDRHALNARAQSWLTADGTLGAGVPIGGARFHVGDRVVAQAKDAELRAEGAARRDHVINGSQGTIVALAGGRRSPDVMVDFDGLGTIRVPHEFVATDVGPGRGGGLSPAYAVTSFKAEGQTFDAGRNLAAPETMNTEGMYVALTRGRNDQRIYSIAPADRLDEAPELPTIADDRDALDALIDSLTKTRGEDLATVADPGAAIVSDLAARPLAAFAANPSIEAARARQLAGERIVAEAIAEPSPLEIANIGPRPSPGPDRDVWDNAIAETALYRERWRVMSITPSGALPPPHRDGPTEQLDHCHRVNAAMEQAWERRLESEPLERLMARRDQVATALEAVPARDEIGPMTDAAIAARHVAEARDRRRNATTRLKTLQAGRRLRIDPNTIEAARRRVTDTGQQLANAQSELQAAKQGLTAVQGDQQAHRKVAATAAAIDTAIDRRIATAVRRPAPYVTSTLGARPPLAGQDRDRWNNTATAIENYRHRHLRLDPAGGPLGTGGPTAAIGARPPEGRSRSAWSRVIAAINDRQIEPTAIERPARRIT